MEQRNPQPQEAAVKAPPAKQPEPAAVLPVEPVVVPSTSLPAEASSQEFKPPGPILVPGEDAQSLESPSPMSFAVPAEPAPVPIDLFANAQVQSAEIGPPPSVSQEASPESHVEASAPPLAPHPAEAVPREVDLPGPPVAPEAVQQSVESSLMDTAADAAESTPVDDDISELAEAPGVEIGPRVSGPQEAPLAPASRPRKAWISRGWIFAIVGQVAALAVLFLAFKFWADRHAPTTIAPYLNSIFGTSDGKLLWAVGSGGTILESDDGGVTWTWHMGNLVELNSVFGTRDGKRAWAVGDSGTILEWDVGSAMVTQRNGGTTDSLQSIFGTPDGKRLWAVGISGTILESDDGGATWTPRGTDAAKWFNSIFGTSDGKRVWAVGTGGTILESEDSGATWMTRSSGTSEWLTSIFGASDGKRLWIVGWNGTILESDDGGASWAARKVNPSRI